MDVTLQSFAAHNISVAFDEEGDKVVNAYDVLRTFNVPKSDCNNCSTTLKALIDSHHLSLTRALFKNAGSRCSHHAPACNAVQLVELIMVLPGLQAAQIRKAAAVLFASWLSMPTKQIANLRRKFGVTDTVAWVLDCNRPRL